MNSSAKSDIAKIVTAMKQAHWSDGPATASTRRDRLDRAARLLSENYSELVTAISDDFGHRSAYQTMAADIMTSIKSLRYAQEHLETWMQSDKVESSSPEMLARVQYQSLGVVGIISPWNFPLNLAFGPMAGALAAGNRVLLKPSELTPATADLLASLISRYFDPMEIGTVLGDADVGAAFSAQAFDHLVFTGSTGVGRHVMRAAAENLVPVTLELGGKSPVMVDIDADIKMAVERTLTVKTFNAGQICLAPDYMLLPVSARTTLVTHAKEFIASIFPTFQDNADYTSIISERHFVRLQGLIEDARTKGATIISLASDDEPPAQLKTRKLAPTLILDVNDNMLVMQEEIFGPLLPILTYEDRQSALDYINTHPRPLAAYYFGPNPVSQEQFAEQTISGGLVINDVMTHVSIEGLPFGGVGPAGMGAYHGIHGFRRFSHAKAIVEQHGEHGQRLRAPYADKQAYLAKLLSPSA